MTGFSLQQGSPNGHYCLKEKAVKGGQSITSMKASPDIAKKLPGVSAKRLSNAILLTVFALTRTLAGLLLQGSGK
ncbi:MAG: hypothetical protein ACE5FV_06260 [Woeseia sp.]